MINFVAKPLTDCLAFQATSDEAGSTARLCVFFVSVLGVRPKGI